MTAEARYFSASYVYDQSAFALLGIEGGYNESQPLFPLLCVVKNLIQRGCPTRPSQALEEVLGPAPVFDRARPRIIDATHDADWTRTIKGAPNGYNPALRFWEMLCAALPEDMAHVRALILPEAPIDRILDADAVRAAGLVGQQVDFYCPLARLVIEIDGSQHAEAAQRILDEKRDELFHRADVRVIRIPTCQLSNPEMAAPVVEALRSRLALQAGRPIEHLRANLPDLASIRAYELVMRMQVAFIELMQIGMLPLDAAEWRVGLTGDAPWEELRIIADAALHDIFDMLAHMAVLAGTDFAAPAVSFTADDPVVTLDASSFRTWDGADAASEPVRPVIRIRSAHDLFRNEFRVSSAKVIEYAILAHGNPAADDALRFFLKLLFGHDDFRPGQLGIVRRALARKPTLGILPTGSGKSACYQLACLLQPAVSFVVCPIISLMQDQERSMRALGIGQVARLDSQMSAGERSRIRTKLGEGCYQMVWVSPERFQNAAFRQDLLRIGRTLGFGYAVIDEVHCLSEWGHDFRVSYLLLNRTFQRFCPGTCLLGLTATASRSVLADLRAELGMASDSIQSASALSRPELHFHIRRTTRDDRLRDLDAVLDEAAKRFSLDGGAVEIFQPHGPATICGIVFANTRTGHAASKDVGCEEIKDHLIVRGISAETYHSGRAEERAQIQQRFMDNEFPIMVATKSFGMGIDKANVRFTVHANLPWSIESFYQEAGRAGRGRSNNESDCYILYVPDEDEDRMRRLFSPSTSIDEIHRMQPELEGDLSTIFFLWTLSHARFGEELMRILGLLSLLDEACDAQGFVTIAVDAVDDNDVRPEHRGAQTEEALYKLAICGLVNDWTRDWNSGTFTVELAERDGGRLRRAEKAVEAYIARHSPGFSVADPRPEHVRYADIYRNEQGGEEARFAALIGMLLSWTNDTIVASRRAAIGDMLALCRSGFDDEQIAAYIDGYFKLDTELADRLERIADDPDDLGAWLDVFYGYSQTDSLSYERHLRSEEELADIAPLADRFREGYPGNIGVEWVSLMAKLLTGTFSQEDVSDQLSYVLNRADQEDSLDFDELVEETDALAKLCGGNAWAAYNNAIAAWRPDFGS